jgi:KDO2-lipid IV(A) lauroyltransferase
MTWFNFTIDLPKGSHYRVKKMPTHKIPESERYRGSIKWLQYVLARGLVSILQRLPIGFAYKLGRGTGWLGWKLMSKRRAVVRQNLKIVNAWMATNARSDATPVASPAPNSSPSTIRHSLSLPLEAQIREVFQRAGANLFSGFTFSQMSPEQVERHIKIEGLEHLQSALSEGKGAIILLAHMGPWEALTQLPGFAARHGIEAPFGAMYRPLNNTYLDDWFKAEREGQGTRLFSRRDGFHKPVDFLRSGGMLGILADQKMRQGPKVPYFGVITPTSPIAGLFQRRSGAAVLAVSIETLDRAQWQISVQPVEWPDMLAPKDRETATQVCNAAIERAVARSPLDAFWLHKRF